MKKFFKKYLGESIGDFPSRIEKREFIYVLIQLRIVIGIEEKERGLRIIPKLFSVIEKTNGDINQFVGDTLLVFYGVPSRGPSLFNDFRALLDELSEMEDVLHAIGGLDVGLYGPFGYEKRFIVTGLSHKLLEDFHKLNDLQIGRIYIHRNLWEKLGSPRMRENIILFKDAD